MIGADATNREHQMACLARHVIGCCSNTDEMRRWFDRWESHHGHTARVQLREAVIAERARAADADLLGDTSPPTRAAAGSNPAAMRDRVRLEGRAMTALAGYRR